MDDVVDIGEDAWVQFFHVTLSNPVKSATLFGVITQTPVYRAPRIVYQNMREPKCVEPPVPQGETPTMRRLQALRSIGKPYNPPPGEAYLLPDDDAMSDWKTDIKLSKTRHIGGVLDPSFYELLKLAGKQRRAERYRESCFGKQRYLRENPYLIPDDDATTSPPGWKKDSARLFRDGVLDPSYHGSLKLAGEQWMAEPYRKSRRTWPTVRANL